jgi:hypothetical protein
MQRVDIPKARRPITVGHEMLCDVFAICERRTQRKLPVPLKLLDPLFGARAVGG